MIVDEGYEKYTNNNGARTKPSDGRYSPRPWKSKNIKVDKKPSWESYDEVSFAHEEVEEMRVVQFLYGSMRE